MLLLIFLTKQVCPAPILVDELVGITIFFLNFLPFLPLLCSEELKNHKTNRGRVFSKKAVRDHMCLSKMFEDEQKSIFQLKLF